MSGALRRSDPARLETVDDNGGGGTVHERLQRLVGRDDQSLKALASLLEEYHTAWQGCASFDKLSESAGADFLPFEEDKVRIWLDS